MLNQILDDLISHRCRLEEEKKILRYAIIDGDLKKANECRRIIAWRESEIRRLKSLIHLTESKAV